MPTVTQTRDVPATADAVWAVAGDFSRYGEWNVTHVEFPEGAPQLAPGVTFTEKVTLMGMPGEVTWRVAEIAAPRILAMEGDGPMGVKLGQRLELTSAGDRTTVTLTASFDGGPIIGPMGDMLAKSAEKAGAESLEKLRGLVG